MMITTTPHNKHYDYGNGNSLFLMRMFGYIQFNVVKDLFEYMNLPLTSADRTCTIDACPAVTLKLNEVTESNQIVIQPNVTDRFCYLRKEIPSDR